MQNENETGLKVGEFVQSEAFVYARRAEIEGKERLMIGYRDEDGFDSTRAEAVFKVHSITPRKPGIHGAFRGDDVVAVRMNDATEEGDEVIEFILGGKGRRSIQSVDVLDPVDDDDDGLSFNLE